MKIDQSIVGKPTCTNLPGIFPSKHSTRSFYVFLVSAPSTVILTVIKYINFVVLIPKTKPGSKRRWQKRNPIVRKNVKLSKEEKRFQLVHMEWTMHISADTPNRGIRRYSSQSTGNISLTYVLKDISTIYVSSPALPMNSKTYIQRGLYKIKHENRDTEEVRLTTECVSYTMRRFLDMGEETHPSAEVTVQKGTFFAWIAFLIHAVSRREKGKITVNLRKGR